MLLQAQGHVCQSLAAQSRPSLRVKGAFAGNTSGLRSFNNTTQPRQRCITHAGGATVVVKHPTKHKLQPLGPDLWNTTYYPKLRDAVANHKPWYIIDAEGQTLGRLAVLAACVLRGKDQPSYSPSMDMGGYVIIINADKVVVTGNKVNQKLYRSHPTAKPGTLKTENFKQLNQRIPERPLEAAIKGMLPKGRLGRKLFTHLKVFKGTRHPHGAQQAADITNRINEKFNNDSPTKGL